MYISSGGEFIFGIRIPDQALVKSDYLPKGDLLNLNQIECPIVYSLRPSLSIEKGPYALVRYGPQYNEKRILCVSFLSTVSRKCTSRWNN